MIENKKIGVDFANFNYEFMKFQKKYKNLCQTICRLPKNNFIKIKNNAIKMVSSFIHEYLFYIESGLIRNQIIKSLNKVDKKITTDLEYIRLGEIENKTQIQSISLENKYFSTLVELLNIIGIVSDELSSTFMPNKSDKEKLFTYNNSNSFFEEFTNYKSEISEIIANFDLTEIDKALSEILGFYFAYYSFIDLKSRNEIENVFNSILSLYLNQEVYTIIKTPYQQLGKTKIKIFKRLDKIIHKSISKIYFRCNYSYSNYGIMPKIKDKTHIDTTLI